MSQILDNLWIANIHNVKDEFFISYTTKATHILNCTQEFPVLYPKPVISKRIPLNDNEEDEELSAVHITEAIDILDDWLQNKDNKVIVHCAAGISRSPTIVLGWLIKKKGMSFENAMDFVHRKRDIIRPNPFFLRFLKVLASLS